MKAKVLLFARKVHLFVILAVLFAPWIAHSGGAEIQPELRFISPTDATSDCIGNPITPLCAVETFEACTLRLEPELCRMVGIDNFNFSETQNSSEYYIVPNGASIDSSLKGPDEAAITILTPDFKADWCPKGCKTSFFLKRVGKFWIVDGYAVWGAP